MRIRLGEFSVLLLLLLGPISRVQAQSASPPPAPLPEPISAASESSDLAPPMNPRQDQALSSPSSYLSSTHLSPSYLSPASPSSPAGFLPAGEDPENRLGPSFMRHLALDQKQFWSAAFRLDGEDARFLLPFAALTGGLIAGDSWISRRVPGTAAAIGRSRSVSEYGTYALLGAAGATYAWGHLVHDEQGRETGVLAGEAALDSAAVAYLLKTLTQRPRPLQENGKGRFFQVGASFPSEHAAIAWSIAGVVAHEYPGTLTKLAAYGVASAVSVTRVTGKQHFSSDVLAGGALGWYVARQIYRARHDPELGGTGWGSSDTAGDSDARNQEREVDREEKLGHPGRMASPYMALDSWVYPALERLAGFGYVKTGFAGMKPWTRLACAHMIEEAGDALAVTDASLMDVSPSNASVANASVTTGSVTTGSVTSTSARGASERGDAEGDLQGLEARLREEFSYEFLLLDGGRNWRSSLDSLYARTVSISGPALTDSYHFGQTVAYDFGRPFERGTNGQAGASWSAAAGPLALYVRGEYQHAPAAPAPSAAALEVIALRDLDATVPPAVGMRAINRPRLLDAYLTVNLGLVELGQWQLAIGRESHSWGPGAGSFLLSDNAEPFDMVEMVNPDPIRLPLFLKFLGPARIDQFLGRLANRTDHANPWVYGQKITFKPFPSLEIGYGRLTTIGGRGGDPFTFENFTLSLFGQVSHRLGSVPGENNNEMDWTWNVPKVRNYIVLYGEVYAFDDFIAWVRPAAYPFRPGIFLTRIPGISRLDLHVEAANTETPGWRSVSGGNTGNVVYFNSGYHEADTNNGVLLGNPVGRDGQTIAGWLTYWASPRQTGQLAYKNNRVDRTFIPGGGAWQDYSLRHQIELRSGVYVKSRVQVEHISRYPLLYSGPQNNLTATVELGLFPRRAR